VRYAFDFGSLFTFFPFGITFVKSFQEEKDENELLMKRKVKILIHVIYWFYMVNQFLYPWYINKTESYFWSDTALNLGLSLINFYAFYFIIPFLIKNRNILLSILTGSLLLIIIAIARYYIEVLFWKEIIHLPSKEMINLNEWFYAGLRLSIISGAYAILIKFAIDWFDTQKLKAEMVNQSQASELALLRSQVNPHFLFNSLNVLTSLVETDSQLAVRFIKQLSDVYRYVLENKDKELVDLKTELRFVKAFIYLQKIRFDNSLQVDISIPNTTANIIPLSLQMLVENAIKHNIVSSDQPLQIIIFTDDHYLVVRNNLQKKMVIKETGSIGLNNIRDRYIFFSTLPVIIEENEEWFTVKLPLIKK